MDNKEYPQRGRNMKTNDRPLTDLMKAVDTGAAQLPDFSILAAPYVEFTNYHRLRAQ